MIGSDHAVWAVLDAVLQAIPSELAAPLGPGQVDPAPSSEQARLVMELAATMDRGEALRSVACGPRVALELFDAHDAWASDVEGLEADQALDAAWRMSALGRLGWRLFPGEASGAAASLLATRAGRALVAWVAAVDLGVAFGQFDELPDDWTPDQILARCAEELAELCEEHAWPEAVQGGAAVLDDLVPILASAAAAAGAAAGDVAEALRGSLPELSDASREALAAEADAVPVYRALIGRVLVEVAGDGAASATAATAPAAAPDPRVAAKLALQAAVARHTEVQERLAEAKAAHEERRTARDAVVDLRAQTPGVEEREAGSVDLPDLGTARGNRDAAAERVAAERASWEDLVEEHERAMAALEALPRVEPVHAVGVDTAALRARIRAVGDQQAAVARAIHAAREAAVVESKAAREEAAAALGAVRDARQVQVPAEVEQVEVERPDGAAVRARHAAAQARCVAARKRLQGLDLTDAREILVGAQDADLEARERAEAASERQGTAEQERDAAQGRVRDLRDRIAALGDARRARLVAALAAARDIVASLDGRIDGQDRNAVSRMAEVVAARSALAERNAPVQGPEGALDEVEGLVEARVRQERALLRRDAAAAALTACEQDVRNARDAAASASAAAAAADTRSEGARETSAGCVREQEARHDAAQALRARLGRVGEALRSGLSAARVRGEGVEQAVAAAGARRVDAEARLAALREERAALASARPGRTTPPVVEAPTAALAAARAALRDRTGACREAEAAIPLEALEAARAALETARAAAAEAARAGAVAVREAEVAGRRCEQARAAADELRVRLEVEGAARRQALEGLTQAARERLASAEARLGATRARVDEVLEGLEGVRETRTGLVAARAARSGAGPGIELEMPDASGAQGRVEAAQIRLAAARDELDEASLAAAVDLFQRGEAAAAAALRVGQEADAKLADATAGVDALVQQVARLRGHRARLSGDVLGAARAAAEEAAQRLAEVEARRASANDALATCASERAALASGAPQAPTMPAPMPPPEGLQAARASLEGLRARVEAARSGSQTSGLDAARLALDAAEASARASEVEARRNAAIAARSQVDEVVATVASQRARLAALSHDAVGAARSHHGDLGARLAQRASEATLARQALLRVAEGRAAIADRLSELPPLASRQAGPDAVALEAARARLIVLRARSIDVPEVPSLDAGEGLEARTLRAARLQARRAHLARLGAKVASLRVDRTRHRLAVAIVKRDRGLQERPDAWAAPADVRRGSAPDPAPLRERASVGRDHWTRVGRDLQASRRALANQMRDAAVWRQAVEKAMEALEEAAERMVAVEGRCDRLEEALERLPKPRRRRRSAPAEPSSEQATVVMERAPSEPEAKQAPKPRVRVWKPPGTE